jgi:hypothetical protein
MPKIELYKVRTFSDKISDTIDYLRENWRPLLKYFTYLMLPASIVLAFFINHFWEGYMSLVSDIGSSGASGDFSRPLSFMLNYGIMALLYTITFVVLNAFVYAMFRLYRERENGLQGLTPEEFRSQFKPCLKRSATLTILGVMLFLAILVVFALVAVLFGSISASLAVFIVLIFCAAVFVLVFPLMLIQPIYMIEDHIGFFDALAKAFRLGFKTWGGILGVTIVIGLLASILQMVTSGPWYVLFIMKTIFTLNNDLDSTFVNSFAFTLLGYLSCILQCIGMLLSMVFTEVGTTIQYGHAAELVDGMGTQEKIERFEEL